MLLPAFAFDRHVGVGNRRTGRNSELNCGEPVGRYRTLANFWETATVRISFVYLREFGPDIYRLIRSHDRESCRERAPIASSWSSRCGGIRCKTYSYSTCLLLTKLSLSCRTQISSKVRYHTVLVCTPNPLLHLHLLGQHLPVARKSIAPKLRSWERPRTA